MIRTRVAQAAPWHPDHHRNAEATAVAQLGGVVDELIEPGRDEVVELHFADRPLAGERGADAYSQDGALAER